MVTSRFALVVLAPLAATVISCRTAAAPTTSASPAPTASVAPAPAELALPSGVTAEMVALGGTIFNSRSCKNCHNVGGGGGMRGPDLTDDRWIHADGSYESIIRIVTDGFTKAEQRDPRYQFSMNPRGGTNLTDPEIRAVAAYVWSLSRKPK